MIRRTRVYVAGPISNGDMIVNTKDGIRAADILLDRGYAPYVPFLTTFWHFAFPHPHEDWMQLDFEWLAACDYVLRLPGDSEGADRECRLAKKLGIFVYHSLDTLFAGTRAIVKDDVVEIPS